MGGVTFNFWYDMYGIYLNVFNYLPSFITNSYLYIYILKVHLLSLVPS